MHPTFLLLRPSPQVALHYKENVTQEEESEDELAEGAVLYFTYSRFPLAFQMNTLEWWFTQIGKSTGFVSMATLIIKEHDPILCFGDHKR